MIASTCLEVVFLILFTVSDNSAFSRGPDSHVEHEAEQILGDNGGDRHPKKDFSFAMKMPGAQSVKAEQYRCTPSKRLSSRKRSYIVAYEPHAKASTAHHILLIGCRYPVSREKIWDCSGLVCDGEEHIIYAWAKNAKAIEMPKGVGFAVGGNTGINYIVMQVHYARELKEGEKDFSGITIHLTHTRVKHLAEIYMLGSAEARIPPTSIGFHANFACRYNRPYDMIPFAFRTHAHSTARVISGYRERDGKWKLIGIGNPQLPQVFYPIPVEQRTAIHDGDILAGRCTYDTPHRTRWTDMGSTSRDEMCNLYLMYYKVYRKGSTHSKRSYSLECMDVEDGISESELKFPASSDKVPDGMKSNDSHSHHHHHDAAMMGGGGEHEAEEGEEDNGNDDDGDDEDDDENGGSDQSANDRRGSDSDGGFDFDGWNFNGRETGETSNGKGRRNGGDDFLGGARSGKTPDDGGFDDRLIKSEPDSQGREPEEASTTEVDPAERLESNNHVKKDRKPKKGGKSRIHDTMNSDLESLPGSITGHGGKVKVSDDQTVKMPKLDGDWPYYRDEWKHIGQVSALGMSKKSLIVLHRADRVWDDTTFDSHERLTHKYRRSKISAPTVLHIDQSTGNVVKKWGEHMFYLPHGLTVDSHDNIWITDVGAHQVYKFSRGDFTKPVLTLGVALKPGRGNDHFCKPADVAVESNGDFYVADGYCNSRILKFSREGDLIRKWGRKNRGHRNAGPFEFNIPHSLALDEQRKVLYVADRENGRIQCFTTHGKFIKIIHDSAFGGRLFAISFIPADGGLLYAVSGPSMDENGPDPSGFTIDPRSKRIIAQWSPFDKGFSQPHDVQGLQNGSAVFVSEIGPNRVWKFNIPQNKEAAPSEQQKQDNGANKETDSSKKASPASSQDPSYILQKPGEDDANFIPALVIVVVLATPIALICAAATIQHLRFKHRKNMVLRKKNGETLSPKQSSACFGCCRTKKFYYDDKRGFDKLIGNEDSDESEDDYFVRKGAI